MGKPKKPNEGTLVSDYQFSEVQRPKIKDVKAAVTLAEMYKQDPEFMEATTEFRKDSKTMGKPKAGKKIISFYITEESIQKLKDLTEIEQRSKGNEIDFLINQRWNDLKKNIESYKKGEFKYVD